MADLDDDLDALLGELSAPTHANEPVAHAPPPQQQQQQQQQQSSAISALDSLLDGDGAVGDDDENVDSLLAELEDTDDALLETSGGGGGGGGGSGGGGSGSGNGAGDDVLGEADRLLAALSTHGESVGGDALDDEMEDLLAALDEPAPASAPASAPAPAAANEQYGLLPGPPAASGGALAYAPQPGDAWPAATGGSNAPQSAGGHYGQLPTQPETDAADAADVISHYSTPSSMANGGFFASGDVQNDDEYADEYNNDYNNNNIANNFDDSNALNNGDNGDFNSNNSGVDEYHNGNGADDHEEGGDNYDDDDAEIGALLADLEVQSPRSTASQAAPPSKRSRRVLKRIGTTRDAFEAAIGETVYAAQEQTGTLDDSIVDLSRRCRTFVEAVREERRAFDEQVRLKLNESLLVVSKGTKGLCMAAQAIGNVPEAQTKMEGILAILQKQLEKIQSQFDTHAPNLLDDDE